MPAFRLRPEPLDAEAESLPKFKWADDSVGTRHQLGGEPESMPLEDRPRCKDCNKTMTFYGQLDSVNDEWCIADVGVICVFFCFECVTVKAEIQSA